MKQAWRIEEAHNQAQKVQAIELAITSAILEGASEAESMEWAFVVLHELAIELCDMLQELENEAFEELKKGLV